MRELLYIAALLIVCLVENVNAGTPFIVKEDSDSPYTTLPENYALGGILFTLHMKDSDSGDLITVTPADSISAEYVNIIATTGNDIHVNLTLKRSLDRETLAIFVLKLYATDKTGNQITITKNVYVSDINDNAPEFKNQPYTFDIPELPCNKNTVVYTSILATDSDIGDNQIVRYSMEATTQSDAWRTEYMATFSIDNTTGHVTLKKCLDYETNNYYQFNVTAYDLGTPRQESYVSLIVRVLDVQDTPPFFTSSLYTANIDENIPKGSSIITIHAVDGDSGKSNYMEYSIISSTCDGFFTINKTHGLITSVADIDRDTNTMNGNSGVCLLEVQASEKDVYSYEQYNSTKTTTLVRISINDLNDNAPKFNQSQYIAEVQTNTPTDVPLTLNSQIIVEDADQGENARMRITLRDEYGTERTDFNVKPTEIQGYGSIAILVNDSSVLNHNIGKQINITIRAAEVANPSHYDETTVAVRISGPLQFRPSFNTTTGWNFEIPENSASNMLVAKITVADVNRTTTDGQIEYSLTGGNGRFVVNRTSGEIRTNCTNCKAELDREKQDVYYMTYTAKDKWDRCDTISVAVRLSDENDNIPMFSRPVYQAFISENEMKYFDLGVTLVATDNDESGTRNSLVSYKIVNATQIEFMNFLTVANDSGEVLIWSSVDYEALSNKDGIVNLTVEAVDNGIPLLTSTATVMISITDENDNAPMFNQSIYTAYVREDVTSYHHYHAVGTVYATDADVTKRNNKLSYFITGGSRGHFDIISYSGMVIVKPYVVLDREQISNYIVTIMALDNGSPPFARTTTMYIEVTDVNDEMPRFVRTDYKATVLENVSAGYIVLNCTAFDPDTRPALVYNISDIHAKNENGADVDKLAVSNYFDINSRSGSVYVSGPLDRETALIITLTLSVSDTAAEFPKPQTDSTNLTISILDVNDNAPEFDSDIYNVSVDQNARNGSILAIIHATDKDFNTTVSYNLVHEGTPTTSFVINSKTGVLYKNGPLNYTDYHFIELKVIAQDDGIPQLQSSIIINVTILANEDEIQVLQTDTAKCTTLADKCSSSQHAANITNPCLKELIRTGNVYFPYPGNDNKYIRCDALGDFWEEDCDSGSQWDEQELICRMPFIYNPCHNRGSLVQSLYPHYCNPRLYVQCDEHGRPFVHTCQNDYVFLPWDLSCVPPCFPGTENLRNTC